MNYIEGDPRALISAKAVSRLIVLPLREAQLVAKAAKKGISLDGASMYVILFHVRRAY